MATQSMCSKLETNAKLWMESGQDVSHLAKSWQFFQLYCWVVSPGGKQTEKSPTLEAYIAACHDENGGSSGWGSMLRERQYCDRCGERYRLENLSVCTGCGNLTCYRCPPRGGKHENGNRLCSCGGEVVG